MSTFEAKCNTKIDIYSSGAKKTEDIKRLYPKFEVINPNK